MLPTNIKSRVTHLGRKVYWSREFIEMGDVVVKHIDRRLNLADIFTKYVPNDVLMR